MRRFTAAAIVASASALAGAAQAADLPFIPAPSYVVSEIPSGWYVRGDIGWRMFTAPGGSLAGSGFTSSAFDDKTSFDLGIGYQARWFRADVTASYAFPTQFIGNTAAASPDVSAKVGPITTLFNAYFDLGTWYHVTPYVGGGLGFSFIRPTEFIAVSLPAGVGAGNPGKFDFAWDLTAGVSFALSRQWIVDASYRFLHIGNPSTNLTGLGIVDYGSMDANEVRVGLRFMID